MATNFAVGFGALVIAKQLARHPWMPSLGIPVAGLLWSVATLLINVEQVANLGLNTSSAVLLVLAGGMAQTVAVWVGFSAILWSMVRGFGGRVTLLSILRLISAACWPLWVAAPAIAFWFSGTEYQTLLIALMCSAGLLGFFTITGQGLAKETRWSTGKAILAVGSAVVFISSFVYLTT